MDPSMWLTLAIWMIVVGYKILYFINNDDQEALDYKTQRWTNVIASYREIKHLVTVSVYESF